MNPKKKESHESYWSSKTFLVVSGASRGIGRQISIDFCKRLGPNSAVFLLARSMLDLTETKNAILKCRTDIYVTVESVDLRQPDYQKFLSSFTQIVKDTEFDDYKIIHNAGSIVVDTPASEMNNLAEWNSYMSANLYSTCILTSAFLKLCNSKNCLIVNISSLCGKVPMKGLAMYCTVKASRESFFKVLALENPSIKVLNYCPGPIDTDMYQTIAESCCFPDMKENFKEMKNSNKLVKVGDTVSKLINILETSSFKSGDTIDYFDEI